jgi:hypothetical protein
MPSVASKFKKVIERNTFYFQNYEFEQENEAYVHSMLQEILNLKDEIDKNGLNREIFVRLLREKENGLYVLLTITGFSQENLLRLLTFIRVNDDKELARITNKNLWFKDGNKEEWKISQIKKILKENENFAEGVVNLFFDGATIPILRKVIPLFEFKKLDIRKLKFELPSLIDTLIRYKIKGSYSASAKNNPEVVLKKLLNEFGLEYASGKLKNIPRNLDFIIPDKKNPKIIIECSYETTTSSGMGDKAKTEIEVGKAIKKFYKNAKFIGFIDGIGWFVRKSDLRKMVSSFDDVFTFHEDEIKRFDKFLRKLIPAST